MLTHEGAALIALYFGYFYTQVQGEGVIICANSSTKESGGGGGKYIHILYFYFFDYLCSIVLSIIK